MNKPLKTAYGASLVAVAMLMMLFVSLRAQQPPATPAQQPPATPAQRRRLEAQPRKDEAPRPRHPRRNRSCRSPPTRSPPTPMRTTARRSRSPASVDQIFTKSSFTVDQRRVGDRTGAAASDRRARAGAEHPAPGRSQELRHRHGRAHQIRSGRSREKSQGLQDRSSAGNRREVCRPPGADRDVGHQRQVRRRRQAAAAAAERRGRSDSRK